MSPVEKRADKPIRKTKPASNRVNKASPRKPHSAPSRPPALYTDTFRDLANQDDAVEEPTMSAQTLKRKVFRDLRQQTPNDKQAAKQYRQDVKALEVAYSTFDGNLVKASDLGHWSLRGMRSTLKSHQLLGCAFMYKREKDTKGPHGGILADVMGMGKTVQTLAVVVGDFHKRQPKRHQRDQQRSPTLVVVPASLLGQWEQECQKHLDTSSRLTFRIYQARKFWAPNGQYLENFYKDDIWLTTYQEVQTSYRVHHQPDTGINYNPEKHAEEKLTSGLLHSADFYRIVLDEGHSIRNPKTACYKSCFSLRAHARWVLTGTPLMNKPRDLWAVLSFLRMPDLPDFESFTAEFFSSDNGRARCQNILALMMLRRTHASRLLGAKLLALPKAMHVRTELTMDLLESRVYDILCQRMRRRIEDIAYQTRFNSSSLKRTISGPYVLMLIRLRQYLSHFAILFDTLFHLLEPEDETMLNTFCDEQKNLEDAEGSELPMARKLIAMIERARQVQLDREMFTVTNRAEPRPNIKFFRITGPPAAVTDSPHAAAYLDLLNYSYASNELTYLTTLYQCVLCRQTHEHRLLHHASAYTAQSAWRHALTRQLRLVTIRLFVYAAKSTMQRNAALKSSALLKRRSRVDWVLAESVALRPRLMMTFGMTKVVKSYIRPSRRQYATRSVHG